jgi:hypothetical protein
VRNVGANRSWEIKQEETEGTEKEIPSLILVKGARASVFHGAILQSFWLWRVAQHLKRAARLAGVKMGREPLGRPSSTLKPCYGKRILDGVEEVKGE